MRFCEVHDQELSDLTEAQLAEISPELNVELLSVLTAAGSVASRNGRGGTAVEAVRAQLAELNGMLAELS